MSLIIVRFAGFSPIFDSLVECLSQTRPSPAKSVWTCGWNQKLRVTHLQLYRRATRLLTYVWHLCHVHGFVSFALARNQEPWQLRQPVGSSRRVSKQAGTHTLHPFRAAIGTAPLLGNTLTTRACACRAE